MRLLLSLFVLLVSCTTGLQVPHYPVDTENQNMLRKANTVVKSVLLTSELPQLQKKKLACRGLFAVGLGDQTALQYFEKALSDELLMARKLSEKGSIVTVEITRLEIFTFSNPRWEIEAVLKIDGTSHPIARGHRIEMSLGEQSDGLFACKRARVEFAELVKEFNREIISKLAPPPSRR